MGNRKSGAADLMHMIVLAPLCHVTLFSITWHIFRYRKRWISRERLQIETKFKI